MLSPGLTLVPSSSLLPMKMSLGSTCAATWPGAREQDRPTMVAQAVLSQKLHDIHSSSLADDRRGDEHLFRLDSGVENAGRLTAARPQPGGEDSTTSAIGPSEDLSLLE